MSLHRFPAVRRWACSAVALALAAVLFLTPAHAGRPQAAVVEPENHPEMAPVATSLTRQLNKAGYDTSRIGFAELGDPAKMNADAFELLAIPNAAELPLPAMAVIDAFAKAGGDILALNTPMWQRALISIGGQWTDHDTYCRENAGAVAEHVLFDFRPESLAGWTRTTDRKENPASYETDPQGPGNGLGSLHARVGKLTGWDTFVSPAIATPFPAEHTLTVFAARGSEKTTELMIEWIEKDLSRWIAVIPLRQEWMLYVLQPEDFRFWDGPAGRKDTRLDPANAHKLSVGLAFTHNRLGGDGHEFWIGPMGTAKPNDTYNALVTVARPPALDTLSPPYKLFDCTGVARLTAREDQAVTGSGRYDVPRVLRSPHPRPRGAGFDKGQQWRWIPVLEARTEEGEWRGAPVTLVAHADGPCKGGMWASFGIGDVEWYLSHAAQGLIRDVARFMREGVFLVDGGTDFYTCFEDQTPTTGARASSLTRNADGKLRARVTVEDADSGKTLERTEWALNLTPGQVSTVKEAWKPRRWPEKGMRVTVELLRKRTVIDRLEHEVFVWKPKEKKSFVTIENGEFVCEGNRWRPHGVNYMPSSGIGTEDHEYFEYWLGARSYDPEVIERDLRHCKDMGFNAVSIFLYHKSMEAQNLLDLLRRLDAHGMKANLSLRPGTPLDFPRDLVREMITHYRLAENDTVFAYDLAWEPMWLQHEARKPHDREWESWIVERYGSVANAEKDWGFAVPRDDAGAVTNPVIPQLDQDGPWRRMVAAYRRFLDTLLYERYGAARQLVRSIDPNHAVSFRMTEAGNPTMRWQGHLAYDWPYLAAAVDILEPEAYSRIGDWERVKPGWFQREYGRYAAPAKPMMWAEAGVSAWVIGAETAPRERLDFQAEFYTHFYRMLIESAADGIFWWWYPGGYRVNERSDYGIINPDGSDRAVTRVIRDHAAPFVAGPSLRPVDLWIEFDRDQHPDGLAAVYDANKQLFWDAVAAGRTPGLRAAGYGTNSATCPAIAVGNTPWTGSNPAKYLDGFFDKVEVKNAEGQWEAIARNGAVKVAAGPVAVRMTVTNLAEAAWAAPKSEDLVGSVYILATAAGKDTLIPLPASLARHATIAIPESIIDDVSEAATAITMTFLAKERGAFGPKFTFTAQR